MDNKLSKIHPGRILLEDYLAARGVSVWHLAKDIGFPSGSTKSFRGNEPSTSTSPTASRITSGCRSYWLDLQPRHDRRRADKSPTEFSGKQLLRSRIKGRVAQDGKSQCKQGNQPHARCD
jgi:plasmid maintenance system antidote protein VapI